MSSQHDQLMWSSLIKLTKERKMSYQRQLIESIVSAILDAKISTHNPLPSSRELSRQLGIARNTVVHAYQQLIDDGYLISKERSGYFVNEKILSGRVSGTNQSVPPGQAEVRFWSSPEWDNDFTLAADGVEQFSRCYT